MDERIIKLEITTAKHEQRIDTLERDIVRIECKMDMIISKIDRFNWWLVLTLGGVSASLILLLYNIMGNQ